MSEWEVVTYDIAFESDDKSGKWLLFMSPQFVDEWWEKVKEATEQGDLGPRAKVSTVPRNNRYVICVYAKDEEDAWVVREGLRGLGVDGPWKIHFKYDWMSASGQKGSAFSA